MTTLVHYINEDDVDALAEQIAIACAKTLDDRGLYLAASFDRRLCQVFARASVAGVLGAPVDITPRSDPALTNVAETSFNVTTDSLREYRKLGKLGPATRCYLAFEGAWKVYLCLINKAFLLEGDFPDFQESVELAEAGWKEAFAKWLDGRDPQHVIWRVYPETWQTEKGIYTRARFIYDENFDNRPQEKD